MYDIHKPYEDRRRSGIESVCSVCNKNTSDIPINYKDYEIPCDISSKDCPLKGDRGWE